MIIKHLTRRSGGSQLFKYLFRYVLDDTKQELGKEQFVIRHNVASRNIEGFVREFRENESHRLNKRKDQVGLHHTILSWSNKDSEHITPEKAQLMAKEYIKLRGDNCMYIGTMHKDRSHLHLHLAISASQLNGKANRLSKKEFASLKVSLDKFQVLKFPELSNSLPLHGRAAKDLPGQTNIRETEKETITKAIEEAYITAQSEQEFIAALQASGCSSYYRAGKLTGVQLESGRKFRFRLLGYGKEKLEELTVREHTANQLTELQTLRTEEKEREPNIENEASLIPVSNELSEFESIRYGARGARGLVLEK